MKYIFLTAALFFVSNVSEISAQITWEDTEVYFDGPNFLSIAINSTDHIYAGSDAGVFYSTNDGDTWTNIGSNLPQPIFLTAIAINDNGDVFVGSSEHGVFRTTDNGNTWTQINNGIDVTVYSLAIRNVYMYVGTAHGVYRSTNDGVSWTEVNNGLVPDPNFSAEITALAINSDDDVFAALATGDIDGGLYRTLNFGSSWTHLTNGLRSDTTHPVFINALAIGSNNIMYVYSWNGEDNRGIFRSTNKGSTWGKRNSGLPNDFVYSLAINSLGHVFAGTGYPYKVYRSTNGGYQWHDMSDGLLGSAHVHSFAINSTGRIFAGASKVWRTNISSVSFALFGSLSNLNTLVLFGTPAVSTINFNPPENPSRQNFAPNIENVEVSIDEALHTRTGDLTFTLEHNGVTVTLIAEAGGNGQDFLSTLLSDDAVEQIGSGTAPFTGFYKPQQPLSAFNGMDPYGEWKLSINDGYAGNDGTLNAWSLQINLDSPILNADDDLELTPDHFMLYQNYPNPFNPSTTISWQSPGSSQQTIKIYDVLGNEVATLVDEYLPAGSHEVEWDAMNVPSGIYFYKLQTEDFVETKKMILLR